MKILSIGVKGFRSFVEVNLALNKQLNVIVGENNVGKSSLLGAINLVRTLPMYALPETYWPDGKWSGPLSLSLSIRLNKLELGKISQKVRFPESTGALSGSALEQKIGNTLSVQIDWERPNHLPTLMMKFTGLDGRQAAHVSPSLGNEVVSREGLLEFGSIVYNEIVALLNEQYIAFPEFRQRPQASATEVLQSTEGIHIASVLFLLKNGTRHQAKRFNKIKGAFGSIFPNLKLEVTKSPGSPPALVIERKRGGRHRLPLESVGAGIAEMVIMLAHISAETSKVFVVDEPELHLHPHSQRLLSGIFRENSLQNQFIVVSHSPHFVDSRELGSVAIVRQESSRTNVIKLEANYLDDQESAAVSKNLGVEEKEFLFSRRVLLVEGPTENGAMPVLAKKILRGFDEHGVSLVSVGGNSFGLMMKVLKGFKFPWLAMCDRDVLMNVSDTIEVEGRELKSSRLFKALQKAGMMNSNDTKVLMECQKVSEVTRDSKSWTVFSDDEFEHFQQCAARHGFRVIVPDFEGCLKENGSKALLEEAERIYGSNKVLQGRYVAEHVTKVPEVLESIIKEITAKDFSVNVS